MSIQNQKRKDLNHAPRRWWGLALTITTIGLAACDLDVESPATVDIESLDSENSIEALWSGMLAQVSHLATGKAGPGGFFTFGALRTDELVHSGLPEQFPHLRPISDGAPIDPDLEGIGQLWDQSMLTRYVVDFGVERAGEIYEKYKDDPLSKVRDRVTRDRMRAFAWGGIAYRILGDNLCEAVIDGGPREPHTLFYERGLEILDEGIAFAEANDVIEVDQLGVRSAYAARAQIRMMMGDWDGAVADAAMVETGFTGLRTGHTTVEPNRRQYNWLRFLDHLANPFADANGGAGRNMTLWGTPFLEWGYNVTADTGNDIRVTYSTHKTNANPHREFGGDDRRPWFRQDKYLSNTGASVFRLATGAEMRLIEAEARLLNGDWQGAVDKINELREWWNDIAGGRLERDGHPLPLVSANSEEEAWELLMKERGIELWLEGRRLPDMRRWSVTPGHVPFEVVREAVGEDPEDDLRRNVLDIAGDFCIPIGATERRLNPNL